MKNEKEIGASVEVSSLAEDIKVGGMTRGARVSVGKVVKMWKVLYCLSVLAAAVGGEDPPENTLESVFAILKKQVPACVGVPVAKTDKNVVLVTAAHCVYGVPNSGLSVQLGGEEKAKVQPINQVIVHPYYKPPSVDYDIAILKAAAEVGEGSAEAGVQVWTLKKEPPSSDVKMSVLGWKWKEAGSRPEKVVAALEERKSCRTKLANYTTVSSRMICANVQFDMVPDGSPLFAEKNIYGVGSYYVRGDKGNAPKVFTYVANSEIYTFIERYV